MNITGVPDTIPRKRYDELLQALGLDIDDLIGLHCDFETVHAKVYALNGDGDRYLTESRTEAATHDICIKITND
jgi:hypothetical protein